ncbi:hypothetical protein CVT24_010612 [Panaeolus cyanescens]|uniref:ER membrane protein complex subunit 2 n=1 Tax=Panaeolus cyanescens TaxID=181874 RepID=A0A409YLU1_9AGAR|nr:hypothetical protein CVT24_010612 [Panaeolus cyanescens]
MSLPQTHTFLFSSLNSVEPQTTRKVHLRRLWDLLQLSLQRQQFDRAKRIWAILIRCKEFDWKVLWTTGLQILSQDDPKTTSHTTIEYLRTMLLQYSEERESILKELITRLLLAGRCREALDELELYLPSFPYQDNPVFHLYASMTCLYLAQSNEGWPSSLRSATLLLIRHSGSIDRGSIRDAKTHLDHAHKLDPSNGMISILSTMARNLPERTQQADDSDSGEEDAKMISTEEHERKRMRI